MLLKIPVLTFGVVAAGVALTAWPGDAPSRTLAYERTYVQAGELWRALTAHLVHPTTAVAAVDLIGLALGGALLEARSRHRLALLLLAAAVVVGVAVHLDARIFHYEGASGVTAAVLVAAALAAVLSWRGPARALAAVALVLIVAKLVAEAAGISWWETSPAPGLQPSATAHLAGAAVGLAAGPAFRKRAPPT